MINERKLVTIRSINKILPHPKADRLEIAIIDGWRVVVGKGEFKADQAVVYFEIDSLLPITAEFEFLRKYSFVKKSWLESLVPNGEGFRIKTIKLRGELSQGLIIPISKELQEFIYTEEGDVDYTKYFNVIKYDPPEVTSNGSEGILHGFPYFIPKTRQERIQNIPSKSLLEVIRAKEVFEITRKYDGSSITVYSIIDREKPTLFTRLINKIIFGLKDAPKYRVGVCSHNCEIDTTLENNKFAQAATETGLIEAVRKLSASVGKELAVQGELCGPGIQGNRHGFDKPTIVVFDIYDITNQKYILPIERRSLVNTLITECGFTGQHVVLEVCDRALPSANIDILLMFSDFKLKNGRENEGLVYKSLSRDFSFKVISNSYLLENE